MNDDDLLELHRLCSAVVDGTLDETRRTRLNALLANSEEARQFYVRNLTLSASLHDYASEVQVEEPEPALSRGSASATRKLEAAERARRELVRACRVEPSNLPLRRTLWSPKVVYALTMLLAMASGFVAFEGLQRTARVAAPAADEDFVATLSAIDGCVWKHEALAVNEELRQGRELALEAGRAEITFASGAQITLEAPARITLASAWEAVLQRGSLRATAPPEAVGFRVSNADVEVTDLGAEFSVLTADGGTEVLVLEGSVEALARDRDEPITLARNQARRFAGNVVTEVRDREQKLKHWANRARLIAFPQLTELACWPLDAATGSTLEGRVTGSNRTTSVPGRLITDAPPDSVFTAGKRGAALRLRAGTEAILPIESSGRYGRSLAFWIKIPRDAALNEAGPIVRLIDREPLELAWNTDPTRGALGALLVRGERGAAIGSTPLRDGEWHHVAIVASGKGRPRHYIDGRLERVTAKVKGSRRGSRALARTVGSQFSQLVLGGSTSEAGRAFVGLIDEVVVADRALSPPEIRKVLKEDGLPTTPTVAAN